MSGTDGGAGGDVVHAAARGEPVALARALVSTPSVNPELEEGGAGEERIAHLAAGWLDGWGFDVAVPEVSPGRFNVVARYGRGAPRLLLNGHLDTVGVEGMTVPPFDAPVEAGRLVGRGACDMKGGVAALLAAAARLAGAAEGAAEEGGAGGGVRNAGAAAAPLPGELIVALTADEEHASLGMQALVEAGVEADAAVVCEPTGLAVMPAHKGFVWVELLFRGRAAHGSRPEEGVDAIRHAALYLASLEDYRLRLLESDPHGLLGHGSLHAGTIAGGSAPSVYPAECRLVLERRTLPAEDEGRVAEDLRAAAEALGSEVEALDVEVRPGLARPGTEVDAGHPLVTGLRAALEAEGVEGRVEGMTAWVDAAFLNEAGVPAVCFGPGSIARAHTADEWVDVEEIRVAARVLERFVRSWGSSG